MTRAQQTLSIGLLLSSVRAARSPMQALLICIDIPRVLSSAHTFYRKDTRRLNTSCKKTAPAESAHAYANYAPFHSIAPFLGPRLVRILPFIQAWLGCFYVQRCSESIRRFDG